MSGKAVGDQQLLVLHCFLFISRERQMNKQEFLETVEVEASQNLAEGKCSLLVSI